MKDYSSRYSTVDAGCPKSRIRNLAGLNFDLHSYRFEDPDLRIAANRLPQRDRNILVLHLMGHRQDDIAKVYKISRSMVSRRLGAIKDNLARQLNS